jgi:hypothetical protein
VPLDVARGAFELAEHDQRLERVGPTAATPDHQADPAGPVGKVAKMNTGRR